MDAWPQIGVALLALGGPFLAYLLAVRKSSGRIKSTEAADLWLEAGNLRRECAERVRVLEARVSDLEERNVVLVNENARLMRAAAGDGHA